MQAFMDRIGYVFHDETLLTTALTHRSFGKDHNERLEFLGDSLLDFIIASELFKLFPGATEGQLSRLRSHLVKGSTLVGIAKQLDLGSVLRLGGGEATDVVRDSILENAVEAVIGAIYLDSNLETCYEIVIGWYRDRFAHLTLADLHKDSKSVLQELLQSKQLPIPQYHLVETKGKEHARCFVVECRVVLLDHVVQAEETSIRRAEQKAAQMVLKELGSDY